MNSYAPIRVKLNERGEVGVVEGQFVGWTYIDEHLSF